MECDQGSCIVGSNLDLGVLGLVCLHARARGLTQVLNVCDLTHRDIAEILSISVTYSGNAFESSFFSSRVMTKL